ncbi:hypothetical protein [Rubrivivax gelatinosus]|uniref:Transmembrane protein n=1 Tax=Rubrivivax gelatinosus (strain NBRC 100245 / IL144) TaxID=983917 RepID=I0HY16_RUBGI|nr:hypothetical protein [Rubrivivax gelatinosus]BAL97903.1 hypothetical protein RGE_45680 [Rubrivivax gelatinosus IL144]
MSDLLSASSLLMAVAAILFSLWYTEIAKALETVPKAHREDNVAAKRFVTAVLLSKALPVSVMALSVALIFAPDAIKLAKESFLAYASDSTSVPSHYDAVRTAYCFVTILSAILAGYMWALVLKLVLLRKQLS